MPERSFWGKEWLSCEIWTKKFEKSKIEEYMRKYDSAWMKKNFIFWLYLPKSHFEANSSLNPRSRSNRFIYSERRYVDICMYSIIYIKSIAICFKL